MSINQEAKWSVWCRSSLDMSAHRAKGRQDLRLPGESRRPSPYRKLQLTSKHIRSPERTSAQSTAPEHLRADRGHILKQSQVLLGGGIVLRGFWTLAARLCSFFACACMGSATRQLEKPSGHGSTVSSLLCANKPAHSCRPFILRRISNREKDNSSQFRRGGDTANNAKQTATSSQIYREKDRSDRRRKAQGTFHGSLVGVTVAESLQVQGSAFLLSADTARVKACLSTLSQLCTSAYTHAVSVSVDPRMS